jgi:hypothetical protein
MNHVILPKTLVSPECHQGPVFFLAGPVLGGGNWQYQAFEMLRKRLKNFHVAIPVRYKPTHPILHHVEVGIANNFPRQTTWERHYLELASKQGCIIFWLPSESKTDPRNDGNPYARDTYGELGEWRGRMMHDPKIRLVIGAEESFSGLSQIRCNFSHALNDLWFPTYTTLEDTLDAAIREIK